MAFYRFQGQLFDRLEEGKTIQEVLDATCAPLKYTWGSDITHFLGKRTIGAKKRNNFLAVQFERPSLEDVCKLKEMFPGKFWAFEHENVEYDANGAEWKLCSPISKEERYRMTPMGREIEEYLYHEKETFQPVAIILRRALMLTKSKWENGVSVDKSPPPSPIQMEGDKWWEIEKLVDSNEDSSLFKIRWKGYTATSDSWKKADDLGEGGPDFIAQFERDGPEHMYFTRSGEDGTINR